MDAWMDGLDGMGISLVQVAETFGVEPASPSGGNNAYMFRQSKWRNPNQNRPPVEFVRKQTLCKKIVSKRTLLTSFCQNEDMIMQQTIKMVFSEEKVVLSKEDYGVVVVLKELSQVFLENEKRRLVWYGQKKNEIHIKVTNSTGPSPKSALTQYGEMENNLS